jgi:tetratricopeptide (TPR) repeat protein
VIDIRSAMAFMSGDRAKGIKIIADAVRSGLANPDILVTYAQDLMAQGMVDSAKSAMTRAMRMNPRYVPTLIAASDLSQTLRDWAGAERSARAMIALDPTDERGWAQLAQTARMRGDSAGIRHAVEEALRFIPSPSNLLLVYMVYAGETLGSRFVQMTPDQLRIETLGDSISTYYDNKADFYLAKGELRRARAYHDSIIGKLEGRNLSGPGESALRLFLANAYAYTGRREEAVREIGRAIALATKGNEFNSDGTLDMDHRVIAAVYGNTGRLKGAIEELRIHLRHSSWTRAGFRVEPKLKPLRGNPAYEAFLKEPD